VPTSSTHWTRCATSLPIGSTVTTKFDHMTRWEACPRRAIASVCSRRKTPVHNCLLDGEAYAWTS
jgi:hypothetical protein